MDDLDFICPLCCEELDISDREFYPCKCGYQVCMWCWHRIRESESGLCPACRTPYGEDPHQFSAVDIEEVLKQQKERKKNSEPPKDRTLLANMRVIRRNLVYAVGLPAAMATEEILRKPEYFGQYGKIAKIVINRTQAMDPRRASASAYVTFVHKEDTLACILALDGFYLEGRNIRASYGTSKYCSAFIKSVRCNNPECTYLHEMGAEEDTFTKQEIQAGYVTSGRDVLARQQQIVAEMQRPMPRKKVGGGGPSGTGKACVSPIFPPPEYEESKPTLVPSPSGVARAVTTGAVLNPANISAKLGRSTSMTQKSPTLTSMPVHRKMQSTGQPAASATTAASVVAGLRTVKSDEAQTISLTPLTPLKRTTKVTSRPLDVEKLRNNKKGERASSSVSTTASAESFESSGIGGDPIGPSLTRNPPVSGIGLLNESDAPVSLDSLGGQPIPMDTLTRSSGLGGDLYTGHLTSNASGQATMIGGSSQDKWNGALSTGLGLGDHHANHVWNSVGTGGSIHDSLGTSSPPVLVGGSFIGHAPGPASTDSTSTLASILGISLPTGSGSLHESSFWSAPAPAPSRLAALNSSAIPAQQGFDGRPMNTASSLIGGVPIGGGLSVSQGPGAVGGASVKSDIALLQSLLPGVHITSGNEFGGVNRLWDSGGNGGAMGSHQHGLGPSGLNGQPIGGGSASSGPSIGTIGQGSLSDSQRRSQGIW